MQSHIFVINILKNFSKKFPVKFSENEEFFIVYQEIKIITVCMQIKKN